MDVDVVKTGATTLAAGTSMDVMALNMMMMHNMEKQLPHDQLCHTFNYNTTTTTTTITPIPSSASLYPPEIEFSGNISSNIIANPSPSPSPSHPHILFSNPNNYQHNLSSSASASDAFMSNIINSQSLQEPTLIQPNAIGRVLKSSSTTNPSEKMNSVATMREMIFRIAVMQPIHIDPEAIKPPKRRNVKISKDPQSVAARHRRERISERIRILQRLVPGGTKMDTASMLDEAIHYVKFLKNQVRTLEQARPNNICTLTMPMGTVGVSDAFSGFIGTDHTTACPNFSKGYPCHDSQINVGSMQVLNYIDEKLAESTDRACYSAL